MGEPVRIADLAENLIRLLGYKPNEDIYIKFTGLKSGEKLFEEMLLLEEGIQEIENKLIYIGRPYWGWWCSDEERSNGGKTCITYLFPLRICPNWKLMKFLKLYVPGGLQPDQGQNSLKVK